MAIKYPIFISYARGRAGKLIGSFMQELQAAVVDEGDAYFDETLWIDREKLRIGDALDQSLRHAICESACVLVVFVPVYKRREYCVAELSAALDLEEKRLAKLGKHVPAGKRLIMTILLRGTKDDLPPVLQDRLYADFSSFTMGDTNLSQHGATIREMVKTIHDRYTELKRASEQGIDVCGDCSSLRFDRVRAEGEVASFPYREEAP